MITYHSTQEIIAELLRTHDQQIGTNPVDNMPWPTFSDGMDDGDYEAISVDAIESIVKGRIQRTGESIFNPRFQVRVRADLKSTAYRKTHEIFMVFESIKRYLFAVEDRRYRIEGIHSQSTPIWIGLDPNAKPSYVLNCTTTIHEVSHE